MNHMRCLCGKTTKRKKLPERLVKRGNGREQIFTNVPADVCPYCNAVYFSPEVSANMLLLEGLKSDSVIPYPSAPPASPSKLRQNYTSIKRNITALVKNNPSTATSLFLVLQPWLDAVIPLHAASGTMKCSKKRTVNRLSRRQPGKTSKRLASKNNGRKR